MLLALAVLVKLLAAFPAKVEAWYSLGFYPALARFSRYITGWIPFSIGDILYLGLGAWLLWSVISLLQIIRKRRFNTLQPWKTASIWLGFYVYFNMFWGLNYNRLGIASQLKLEIKEPETGELAQLCAQLLERTNRYASFSRKPNGGNQERIRQSAREAFASLSPQYPFLHYSPSCIKGSLFGKVGNYVGYTGYFNPLTGEAQVNETVPPVLFGFVTCHEIAHQLGYAKENEANFVGFLAARQSGDSLLRYSAYFDMFLYANNQLYREDSALARKNMLALDTLARMDLADLRKFRIRYRSFVEVWVDQFYNLYLKANQQPSGRMSYSRVVLWLLAEYRRTGRI